MILHPIKCRLPLQRSRAFHSTSSFRPKQSQFVLSSNPGLRYSTFLSLQHTHNPILTITYAIRFTPNHGSSAYKTSKPWFLLLKMHRISLIYYPLSGLNYITYIQLQTFLTIINTYHPYIYYQCSKYKLIPVHNLCIISS